jgi:membrane-bound lytic murein transglycosylase D
MEEPLPMNFLPWTARCLSALLLTATAVLSGCATAPAGLDAATASVPASPVLSATPSAEPDASTSQRAAFARARLDPADDAARGDLWVRVRSGLLMPDIDGDLVIKWEQYYAGRPDYVQRMTERGGRYLFHIVEEVERRGMPSELALLPFIESAFNPQAMSVASAAGMWQFMPATGKDFDLRQNLFRDDRRDVLASTKAALDYLQLLQRQFGDWHLALAAYNWGRGNVQRAIDRNQKAGLPTDYLSLRMPDETRNYVPKLQAVENIVRRPAAFSLQLPVLENHPFFLSVPIERDIDVAIATRLAGVSLDEFQQLNPQMNKPVILAAGTPQVLLPYDNANRFLQNLEVHRGPLASWTAWVAPRTLKPADAARELGMPEEQLRDANRIPPRMLIKAGSTLLVPRSAQSGGDVAGHVADSAMISLAPDVPPLQRISYKAGKGDSVKSVARKHRVSPANVARWNDVGVGTRFKPGDSVILMVPQPSTRAGTTRKAPVKPVVVKKPQATKR